jgi:hypothetical protein
MHHLLIESFPTIPNTKSATRDIMVWEISMGQTKQTNYLRTEIDDDTRTIGVNP